jgi:hypothetical protein
MVMPLTWCWYDPKQPIANKEKEVISENKWKRPVGANKQTNSLMDNAEHEVLEYPWDDATKIRSLDRFY